MGDRRSSIFVPFLLVRLSSTSVESGLGLFIDRTLAVLARDGGHGEDEVRDPKRDGDEKCEQGTEPAQHEGRQAQQSSGGQQASVDGAVPQFLCFSHFTLQVIKTYPQGPLFSQFWDVDSDIIRRGSPYPVKNAGADVLRAAGLRRVGLVASLSASAAIRP